MKCYLDQIPECYVLSATSGKAQSWRKSVLTLRLYLMLVKSTMKFLLTNMVLKEAGKIILTIFVIQVHMFTSI